MLSMACAPSICPGCRGCDSGQSGEHDEERCGRQGEGWGGVIAGEAKRPSLRDGRSGSPRLALAMTIVGTDRGGILHPIAPGWDCPRTSCRSNRGRDDVRSGRIATAFEFDQSCRSGPDRFVRGGTGEVGPGEQGLDLPVVSSDTPSTATSPATRKGHRRGEPPCRTTSSRDLWPAARGRSAASSKQPRAGSSPTVG